MVFYECWVRGVERKGGCWVGGALLLLLLLLLIFKRCFFVFCVFCGFLTNILRCPSLRYADAKAQLAGTKDRLGQVAKELDNIKKDNSETQGGLSLKERKVQLLKLEFAGSGGKNKD